ncbi:hypothetical protein EVC24_164 [Rhizobium phage RHph_I4]|nr:hypothetical protein EVC24_164 [Rhizobium phage RHph_I4]
MLDILIPLLLSLAFVIVGVVFFVSVFLEGSKPKRTKKAIASAASTAIGFGLLAYVNYIF